MRKLMMLAAMAAMALLLVATTAIAQTSGDNNIVQRGTATLNQSNTGDQIARNDADQDADADQFQHNPGGAGGGGGGGGGASIVVDDDDGRSLFCLLFPGANVCR